MGKSFRKYILISVVAFLVICLLFSVFASKKLSTRTLDTTKYMEKKYLLKDDQLGVNWISFSQDEVYQSVDFGDFGVMDSEGITRTGEGISIETGSTAAISLTVAEEGTYQLLAQYLPVESNMFDNTILTEINGESYRCLMPFIWEDIPSADNHDKYGNEVVLDQRLADCSSINYFEDYNSFTRLPINFHLKKGVNILSITPENQDIIICSIKVMKLNPDILYSEYANNHQDSIGTDFIIVEGEDYRAKSDSYIRGRNVKNTGVVPNDPYVKLINAIDDKSNKTIGQKLIYEFNVKASGLYNIAFKYSQPLKTGGSVYRTLEIDGKALYKEARDIAFSNTGIDKYENYIVGGEETPQSVWLDEGVHTLALKTTAAPIDELYQELLSIINEINDTSLLIKKIKGSNSDSSANIDNNRTWNILQYIPDITSNLEAWIGRIGKVYEKLEKLSGSKPSYASDLMLAVQNLERLQAEPSKIPNRLGLLSDESSSAAQLVGLVLPKLYEQNLSIDRIYIYGEKELPSPKSNFVKGIWNGIQEFLYSFTPTMNETVDIKSGEALTVWINKPTQYVEVLQELTDKDFTMTTGINVEFSIMPDEKRIVLANSTGNNPDVALGLSYYRPVEFAMRGIAKNLLDYDDFIQWYSQEYNLESLVPMSYDGGIYSASETQDFQVLFYRTDILEMLGLEVPQTWDDVEAMMPALLRNAMNFYLPLTGNAGLKGFSATSPFVFQNGGDFYAEDGLIAGLNNPATLKGLREMVELYSIYGLAQNQPNFYNAFKSASTPIGISNFASYLQLQVSAPELAGRWDIALTPGTQQEDGTISRYQTADVTSAMIFENSSMPEEAYQFLKWWLSSKTQISYSNDLQRKFGNDFIWNTANLKAFEQMSYSKKHKDIILKQWTWQKEVNRHPASYILEREVSNMWINVVTKGLPFQPQVDQAIIASNREMKRKLTEFGYYDDQGNQIKDYDMNTVSDIIKELKEGR